MALKKTTRRRGRKPIVERERQQVSRSSWELNNRTREDLTSLAERQLWDMQDELLALREASKEEQLSAIDKAIKPLYLEYPLVAERAGGVGVSVQCWWLLRGSVVQKWNCGLYRDDFLLTSRGYKELRIL